MKVEPLLILYSQHLLQCLIHVYLIIVEWMKKCTNQLLRKNNHIELWAEVLESRNCLFFHLLHPAQSLAHRRRSGNVYKQENALCKGLDPCWIQLHSNEHQNIGLDNCSGSFHYVPKIETSTNTGRGKALTRKAELKFSNPVVAIWSWASHFPNLDHSFPTGKMKQLGVDDGVHSNSPTVVEFVSGASPGKAALK